MTLAFWRAVLPPNVADKLKVEGRCWVWTGATNAPWHSRGWGGGYGYVKYKGKAVRVHRLVWRAVGLSLRKTDNLLHQTGCVRKCANPSHLRKGTHSENREQMWADGSRDH